MIATALAVGGVFNMVSMVLAEGTAAGTQISNTATATYRDPEGTPQTSTSNTVVVEVAEIAGITVVNTGAERYQTGTGVLTGAVQPGDEILYTFEITNVGNDETDISLPAVAGFSGPVDSVVSIMADLNRDGTFVPITSRTDIENLAPGESFDVRVVVQTSTTAQSGDIVTVQYGDTPGDGQNQPYDSSGGSVFTDDNDGTDVANTVGSPNNNANTQNPPDPATSFIGEASVNPPANGEREASATGAITINEEPLLQPLVRIEKDFTSLTENAAGIDDDQLTYSLSVDVLDTVPAGSDADAADLQPITLDVVGSTEEKFVLISDAIPVGTSLDSVTVPNADWKAVYTTDSVDATDIANYKDAVSAEWTIFDPASPPANLSTATRVGFVYDPSAGPRSIAITAPIVTGFEITVVADDFGATPTPPITVANIAQVFGSGVEDDPLTPEDESLTFPVMDESGDQTPSNYDPITDTYSSFNPDVIDNPSTPLPEGFTPDDGLINDPTDLITKGVDPGSDTTNPGNDPSDDNTGDPDDGDGEAIVVTLVEEPDSDLLNGPDGSPDAVGPTGTNDDFTNKSAPFSGGNPPLVAFTNTVENGSDQDGWVTLTPIAPQNPTDLPSTTTATIIAPDGTRTTFTYDNTGLGTWTKTSGPDVVVPIRADDTVPGAGDDQFDYGVEVNLEGVGIAELDSYPVPILATFDSITNGQDGAVDSQNITIDRVYTGFLELVKTAQVVQGDGPPVSGNPAPGNYIRYRVTYTNISETEVGTMQGNVLLTASDLAILEDGTERACDYSVLTTANNWALDNDNGDGDTDFGTDLDTRHVPSSVNLSNLDAGSTASVSFFSGGPDCVGPVPSTPDFDPALATPGTEQSGTTYGTDSTKYVFDVTGDIEPLESGFIEFERRVN
ncbi:MAG: hypothetical protein AAFV72_03630 [Cyanobacteria bacterium J06635_1]